MSIKVHILLQKRAIKITGKKGQTTANKNYKLVDIDTSIFSLVHIEKSGIHRNNGLCVPTYVWHALLQ